MQRFSDRQQAGRQLAEQMSAYADRPDVIVLALPRGGVPVAFELIQHLHVPMDVFLVRKLGVPGQEELAMGAIASGGVRVLNRNVVGPLGISEDQIQQVAEREREELQRRETAYRGDRPAAEVKGRTAVLVDDGLATGATMRAAVKAVKQRGPAQVVVAVPVAPASTVQALAEDVDEVICLGTPEPFGGVGAWYENFEQTTDEEVRDLLGQASEAHPQTASAESAKGENP